MSRTSYGLQVERRQQFPVDLNKSGLIIERTYLSLNALRIRSTSTSRWKADASRLSSFSSSASEMAGVGFGSGFELEAWADMVQC